MNMTAMLLSNIFPRLYDYTLGKKYPNYKEHPISVTKMTPSEES